MRLKFYRIRQMLSYGWQHAKKIHKRQDVSKSTLAIFFDIIGCYFRYNVWSNQYTAEKLYAKTGAEREEICLKYQKANTHRDKWITDYYQNCRFLAKWTSLKYQANPKLPHIRSEAYQKQYNMPNYCLIGYGVMISQMHYQDGYFKNGTDCMIREDCSIDITGGLTLGNKVSISEGCKILTHNHEMDFNNTTDDTHGTVQTPLVLHDRVWLGAKSIIMPGVKEIGRGAMISSQACVRHPVPPYAIMLGNPAKIVGFRMTPDELAAFEAKEYPESERIPLEVLQANYKKYFLDHIKEIKNYLSVMVK